MYGRSPILPCDPQNPMLSFQFDPTHVAKLNNYVSSLSTTARHNISLAQSFSKSTYDRNRSDPSYQIKDIVLLRNIPRRYKFDVRYEGPYRIMKRINHKTYVLQHIRLQHIVRQVTVDSILPLFDRTYT